MESEVTTVKPAYEIMPNVIHEELEGEFIIINLDTGVYFSMNAVGAKIWRGLLQRAPESSIVDNLTRTFGGDPSIGGAVKAFLESLLQAKLIQPTSNPGTLVDEGAGSVPAPGTTFIAPVLEQYQDMRDLLLLDPIHDVNEATGWPQAKKSG
jgi:hypothetical protein